VYGDARDVNNSRDALLKGRQGHDAASVPRKQTLDSSDNENIMIGGIGYVGEDGRDGGEAVVGCR
jgi:hypothetical protein